MNTTDASPRVPAATCETGPEGTTCWLNRTAQSYGNFAPSVVNTNRLLKDRAGLRLQRELNLNAALPVELLVAKTDAISWSISGRRICRARLSRPLTMARRIPAIIARGAAATPGRYLACATRAWDSARHSLIPANSASGVNGLRRQRDAPSSSAMRKKSGAGALRLAKA
jgi:hypothetical protein